MAKRYFYVKDGTIIEGPRVLPKAWKNTSGFHLQTDEELRERGWLPEEEIDKDAAVGSTEVKEGPIREILSDRVKSRWTVREKTTEEIAVDTLANAERVTLEFGTPQHRFNFQMHNRVRVIEGKKPLTVKQHRDWWAENVTSG
jgi:hypothetical protein